MERLLFECPVASDVEAVKNGFNLDLFKELAPPLIQFKVDRFDGCSPGDEVHIRVGLGVMVKWISEITEEISNADQEWYFIDEGVKMPFPLVKWKHIHRVVKSDQGSTIIDDINFSCGNSITDKIMRPILKKQFSGRAAIYKKVFGSP